VNWVRRALHQDMHPVDPFPMRARE
jgi:hypothetical protein